MKMPNQPLVEGRFVANPIVKYLLEEGGLDMNQLSIWSQESNIDDEYKAQFAQLIGYSLGGWSMLSYVTDSKWNTVVEEDNED